jgi:predicted HTH transcriptional regulator
MTPTELKKLIRKGESNSLEFKSHFSNEAIETIAAFSNTRGGTLLVGVSTPRNVQVADMFKEAGVIERYGSGIGRIVDDFKAYGLAVECHDIVDNFKCQDIVDSQQFIVVCNQIHLPGFYPETALVFVL